MTLLAFAASLRAASLNRRLLDRALTFIAGHPEVTVDHASFAEFDMPLYNGDVNEKEGLPSGALELSRRIVQADAILIASPEYNYSLPGTLKNALDWISRQRPMPTQGKTGMIMSASTSLVGGIRGLWQLRIPLEGMGVTLMPDMFALSQAQNAFAEDGSLLDRNLDDRMRGAVERFLESAGKLRTT